MNGAPHPSRETPAEIERKLLAALCQGTLDPHARAAVLLRLNVHVFVDPDHQVIYRALDRALTGASLTGARDMPHALAQAATRLGFPDLDIESFFRETPAAPEEVPRLLERL